MAVITIEEFRAKLDAQGKSVRQWAKENGFNIHLVNAINIGRLKCKRGQAHEIAVAMGIKADPDAPDTSAV